MNGFKINSKEQFLDDIVKCSEENLKFTIANKKNAYCCYTKTKKTGKRTIYSINKNHGLYNVQNNIQTVFFLNILFPECVCGFRKRKSYYDFLIPHVTNNKSRYYLRLDISNFFDSIRVNDIKECLSYYISKDISDDEKDWIINTIIDIATYNNKVIQGAITSPILSNLVFRSLDIRIERYCDKMGIKYTRYADDLFFSSDTSYIHNYKFQNMIKTILDSKGFKVNNKKTLKYKNEISLNGYVVGTSIRLSRKKMISLNKILFAMKNNKFKGFKSRKAMYITKNKLAGYRAFLIQSIPYLSEEKAHQVKKKIIEIETLISKYCIEK